MKPVPRHQPTPAASAERFRTARAPRREAWVWFVYAVACAGALFFLLLGIETTASWHPRLYRTGPLVLGLLGAAGFALGLATSLLARPFLRRGRLPAFALAGACLLIGGCPIPYPSPYAARPSALPFRLPFEGEWRVRFGAEKPYWNPLVLEPDRRYGFEFWRPGASGEPGAETSVGAPVLAPAPGSVAAVRPLPEDAGAGTAARVVVSLRVAAEAYALLGGLDAASVPWQAGEAVAAGALLGRVGAPPGAGAGGPATLRFHLQDRPEPGTGIGVPFAFVDIVVEGEARPRASPAGGYLPGRDAAGWRVRNAPPPARESPALGPEEGKSKEPGDPRDGPSSDGGR